MGLLSDILGFIEDLSNGSSYYKEIALSGVTRHGGVCATLNVAKHGSIKLETRFIVNYTSF